MELLVIVLFFDLVYGIPLFMIAFKSEHAYSWLAFIPIANLWLMCDMTDLSLLWIVGTLIPFIGGFIAIVFTIIAWMRLSENTNKPSWLGALMILPIVNWVIGYYIAFTPS